MKAVSIIIPTLNEAGNIDKLIKHILRVMKKVSLVAEIVVVDDGSTDGTREQVADLADRYPIVLVCRDQQRGLASAVIEGAHHARNDVLVIMDGDLSHSPEYLPEMVNPLITGVADIVIGSRYVRGGETQGWPIKRRIASGLASLPAQTMTGVDDPLSGFFAVRRAQLLAMTKEVKGYKICLELLLSQKEHLKVFEIPITFCDRQSGKSKMDFTVLKDYFIQISGLCGLKYPKNVWCILPYLLFVGLLSDVMLFRLFSSYGVTLLIAQVAGLLGSIAMIGIAGRIFWPDIMSGYRITFSPLFAFGTFLLIILRSGFFILAYQSVWEGTVFPPILIAAFSSMVISLYLTTLISSRKQGAINPILQSRFILLAVILISVVLRLLFAGSFELLHQEAYYWNYAQHLASGYLDHPPMVALLIKSGSFFFGNTEFAVRIGAILCWGIASLFVFFYSRDISNRDTALQTVTLMSVLPAFFSFGLLMTPDAPLIACWAGSIFYARRAIVEMDGKSWIGVGLFLGLGLISKYTIAILGLSFLVFIISDASSRRWLLKPQPYLSAALALLIFSPVIWWNSQHEWVSFLFQTKERLVSSSEFSSHELFASIILLLSPLGFWVAMLFLLNRKYFVEKAVQSAVRQYKFALIMVAVPFTVFLIFSLTKEVKLNWTTPIWLAALPYMASTINKITNSVKSISFGRIYFPRAWTITIVTLLLAYGSALHYFSIGIPGIPYPSYGPLFGWNNYANQINKIVQTIEKNTGSRPRVVGLDQYKTVSGLTFYRTACANNEECLNSPPLLSETIGRNVFGPAALMYNYWFPGHDYQAKPFLILSQRQEDVEQMGLVGDIGTVGETRTLKGKKNNQETAPLYYKYLNIPRF